MYITHTHKHKTERSTKEKYSFPIFLLIHFILLFCLVFYIQKVAKSCIVTSDIRVIS